MRFNLYPRLKRFHNLKDNSKFAIIMSFVAFLFGLYWYTIPMAAEHIFFFISAPIATYFPSLIGWKITFKSSKDYKIGNLIGLSVILSPIVHYINFVVLYIVRLFQSVFSQYVETETLLGSLTYLTFLRMMISLYLVGLITVLTFILTGIYVFKTQKTESNSR